jgi:hypothetical protein
MAKYINQTTFFFCENQEAVNCIKSFRRDLSTNHTIYPIRMFISNKYYHSNWVHPVHNVPSPDLGKIWHEKIHLMKMAKNMDIQATQYHYGVMLEYQLCVMKRHQTFALISRILIAYLMINSAMLMEI